MPRVEKFISVHIKTQGHLCISVEDQGFGIENEKLEKNWQGVLHNKGDWYRTWINDYI